MWLGRARREGQTTQAAFAGRSRAPGRLAWMLRVRDGGPSKGETTVPGFAGGGGLARIGTSAAPLGFARAGAPVLARHSVGRPEPGRGRGGARRVGRG